MFSLISNLLDGGETSSPIVPTDLVLMENNDYILTESGDKILRE